jgi:hypothetical protein
MRVRVRVGVHVRIMYPCLLQRTVDSSRDVLFECWIFLFVRGLGLGLGLGFGFRFRVRVRVRIKG